MHWILLRCLTLPHSVPSPVIQKQPHPLAITTTEILLAPNSRLITEYNIESVSIHGCAPEPVEPP